MKKLTMKLLLLAVMVLPFSSVFAQDAEVTLPLIGEYHTGIFDAGAAEISAYDPGTMRLFFTNAEDNSIVVLDLSDPENPSEVITIDMSTYGGGVNSVAVNNGIVAIAVEANEVTDAGSVVFFDASSADFATPTANVTAGALPDMVTFTTDGDYVLVANEGEPNDDYTVDPEGSVTVIDISGGVGSASASTATFTALSADSATLVSNGLRIFGPGATFEQDLEPEYIAVNGDNTIGYVALQENNAVAILDIATASFTSIVPLGFKDHSAVGNELDASNDDDAINIQNWPVKGMYQPDAITTVTMSGNTYILSANEGDARDYDGFSEEHRIRDFRLNPSVFTDATLQDNENLGRLRTTSTLGMNTDSLFFIMEADSAQEVTGGDNRGEGIGEFKYDVSAQTLEFTMFFDGLDFNGFNGMDSLTTDDNTDDVTAMHIHNAASGVNGGVVFNILGDADTQVSTDAEGITTITGTWSESDASFAPFLAEMQSALFEDEISLYVNVHTQGQASGAIRGQLYADPMFDELYSYGARSFSVWNGTTGALIWDSGSEFETKLAELVPSDFNSTNSENDSFDNRSDDKGPEPEAITVATIGGKFYAMIGLERIGGVMVYDITNPAAPEFVSYANERNFSELDFNEDVIEELDDAGSDDIIADIMESTVASGPESITFIKQGASPVGYPLAVVSNEVTGSITVHAVDFASESAPLFISEYADGDGGNNKYIELYNPTNEDVALGNYAIARVSNAPSVPGDYENWEAFAATDTIRANSTFLWVNPSAVDSLLNLADATGSAFFNGDDAVALMFGSEDNYEVLDMFGDFFGDPGSGWDVAGVTSGTADRTLIRKAVIKEGNPAPQGSFGTSEQNSEWIVGADGANDFSNAGMHMIDNSIMLTILHNNDGESQLIALSSDESDTLNNYGGVARFKTVVDNLRDEADYPGSASILLSSGDNFLAGPEFNAGVNDGVFYDAIALDALGYDAIAIGNHDFDFGPETLADFIAELGPDAPPFVSANLDFSNEPSLQALYDAGNIVSNTIVEAGGQMIGIVGATTDNLPFISSPGNVEVSNMIATLVQAEIDSLESLGINKIVLISHLQGIQEDSTLATQLSGIDVMIAGGGDELLANAGDLLVPGDEDQVYSAYPLLVNNGDGDEIPIVTTKGSYGYVGKLVVEFDANGDIVDVTDDSGPVRVSGDANSVDAVVADAELLLDVVEPVATYLDDLAANVIAETLVPLNGVRSSVRSTETNLGNLIADAYLAVAQDRAADFGAAVPEVAVQNGGGIRNDNVIGVGDLTELLTFDVLPFGNFLSVVEDIDPATMKNIAENMVARINEDGVAEGDGTGRFGQPAGFAFTYDLEEQPRTFDEDDNVVNEGSRVIDLILDDGTFLVKDGMVVQGAPSVALATGNFTANGGDQYPFGGRDFTRLGITDQQTLALYLTDEAYLDGQVLESSYPEGGLGRINVIGETSIQDARETPDDVRVTVEGVIIRPSGRIARIVDETGATAIFDFGGDFRTAVEAGEILEGDYLRLTGKISPFNGLHEISDIEKFEVLSSNNPLPPAIPATLEDIAEFGEFFESNLIVVYDVEVDTDDSVFLASTTYDLVGESGVSLRIQSGGSNESTAVIGTPIPDGPFTFVGTLGQFDGSNPRDEGYQLLPVFPTDIRPAGFTLTLLHNNDGESQLVNLGSGKEDFGGVARFSSLVDRERNMNESMGRGVLMLSSGDNFLAGPEYTVGVADSVFYDAIAIDWIGYDALSLGNHDFDFGPDVAFDFMSQIESIFLSANLDFSANDSLSKLEDEDRLAQGVIFEVNGQDVGVIGAITPNLPFISSPGDVEVDDDVAGAVQNVVDNMELLGVNKIILISHLQGVEEDSLLATELSGVDIMIAGGGDDLLANDGDLLVPGDEAGGSYPLYAPDADNNMVPIVSTAGNYSYLGKLVVNFDAEGNLTEVLDESGPIRVAGGDNEDAVPADEFLQEFVVDPLEEGLSILEANVIATSEVALQGGSDNVRSKETNTGDIVTDAYLWQAAEIAANFGAPVPEIAIANGGGIRNGEIPAGNFTELNSFDVLPFLNFLTVVENITPEQLKLILENAVSRIVLVDGVPTRQGDGTGRFAQVAGFEFTYNATLDPLVYDSEGNITFEGNRIIDVTLADGTPIIEKGQIADGAPTVNLATADFTARGGDQYPFNIGTFDNPFTLLGVTYQQTLFNYMVASTSEGGLGGSITAAQYPVDGEGRIALTSELPVNNEPTEDGLPTVFALQQNYPNPFNPSTNIQFDLPENANVNLTVYNMLGQRVMTLVNERMQAGYHTVTFDARSMASGMYIYRIEAGSYVSTKKMMLIK